MSLLNDASLILVPSAIKTGEVLVQKPLPNKFADETGNYDGNDPQGSANLTFTRASSASRIAPNGLLEKVRTNLALYSEDFTNAAWANISSATVTGDTTTAPNGTTTADTITAGGGSSTSRVRQSFAFVAGAQYAISIYVKANDSLEGRFATLNSGGTTRSSVTFSNTAGVVAISGSTGGGTTNIESVGSGWYRISHQIVINDQSTLDFFADRNGTNLSWYTWGAMIETGVLTPYIGPTTSAAVSVGPVSGLPRLDYLNSSCPSLLLEPQRTNLVTYSEQINDASWSKALVGAGVAPVVTANYGISPSGYADADRIQFNAGGTTGSDRSLLRKLITLTATQHALSFYVKSNSGTVTLAFTFNGGTVGSITATESGWTRVSYVGTGTGALSTYGIELQGSTTSQTADILFWGAQLEEGAYATSYVNTLNSAVTRLADSCYKTGTGISSLIGQSEGTLFFEFNVENINGQTNDPVLVYLRGTGTESYLQLNDTGRLDAVYYASGATQCRLQKIISEGTHKVAFAYKANDFILYIDGVLAAADTSGVIGTLNEFGLQYYNSTYFGQQKVNQALLFKTRLTNAKLAELTTL
jgi:hypothetical protein